MHAKCIKKNLTDLIHISHHCFWTSEKEEWTYIEEVTGYVDTYSAFRCCAIMAGIFQYMRVLEQEYKQRPLAQD